MVPVRSIWNHKFDTTQPRDQEILLLNNSGREKVRRLELPNVHYMIYKDILTESHYRAFGV